MGVHGYQNIWWPVVDEKLTTNITQKYTVYVKKGEKIIRHLMKGHIEITGKTVNLGLSKRMHLPCKLLFAGRKYFIELLSEKLNPINPGLLALELTLGGGVFHSPP